MMKDQQLMRESGMAQMVKDQQLMRESGMTTNGIATKGLESASGSGSQST
jgi:hypothetical protein